MLNAYDLTRVQEERTRLFNRTLGIHKALQVGSAFFAGNQDCNHATQHNAGIIGICTLRENGRAYTAGYALGVPAYSLVIEDNEIIHPVLGVNGDRLIAAFEGLNLRCFLFPDAGELGLFLGQRGLQTGRGLEFTRGVDESIQELRMRFSLTTPHANPRKAAIGA